MSRQVIIGTDGSSRAEDAVALAALLAVPLSAEPTLLYAQPHGDIESIVCDGDHEQLIAEVVATASRHARTHFGESAAPGMCVVADRSPARALQAAAAAEDAAAIIVGSSHRGAIGRVLPGGVAERLLSGAPCPIVVAPAGFAARVPLGIGAIGAGFDGSAEASDALRAAAALARADDSPLVVIAVHQQIAFGHLPVAADRADVSVNAQMRSHLAERLWLAVAELGMGDQVTQILRDGAPAAILADASEHLGLLVVGSRGHGPVGQVLLGSVAHRVLRGSASPVMVVPRSAGERSPS